MLAIKIKTKNRNIRNYLKAIEKGYWCGLLNYAEDVTSKWLGVKKKKNNHIIQHYIGDKFKYKNHEYIIDGRDIVIDYKEGEVDMALYLAKLTDKRIEMFPRFNKPENKKSADYKIGREYIDYKHTNGDNDQVIYHNIQFSKKQANGFVIKINNEDITQDEILYQVDNVFRRINWIKTLIIVSKYGINVYKKKNN